MFEPVQVRRVLRREGQGRMTSRKVDVEEGATDIKPEQFEGKQFIYIKVDKTALKLIKSAMMVQRNRTTDVRYFDPEKDKDEIKDVLDTAEEVSRAYDVVSK